TRVWGAIGFERGEAIGPEPPERSTAGAPSAPCPLMYRAKLARRWSGTPPQDSTSCSYRCVWSFRYGRSGPKNVRSDLAASSRAALLSDPHTPTVALSHWSLMALPTGEDWRTRCLYILLCGARYDGAATLSAIT